MTSLKEFGNGYNGPWEFFAKLFLEGNGEYVSAFSPKNLTSESHLGCLCGYVRGDRTPENTVPVCFDAHA